MSIVVYILFLINVLNCRIINTVPTYKCQDLVDPGKSYKCPEFSRVSFALPDRQIQIQYLEPTESGNIQMITMIVRNVTDPVQLARENNQQQMRKWFKFEDKNPIIEHYEKGNLRITIMERRYFYQPNIPVVFENGQELENYVRVTHNEILHFAEQIQNLNQKKYVFGNFNIETVVQQLTKYSIFDLDFATEIGQKLKDVTPINSIDPRLLADESDEGIPVDETMDYYSLGVVIYQMIQNKPPFEGETRQEILEKIKKGDITFTGIVYPEFAFMAHGLMRSDPDERLTIYEVISLLQLALNQKDKKILKTPLIVNIHQEFDETERARIMHNFNEVFNDSQIHHNNKKNEKKGQTLKAWINEKFGSEPWIVISTVCGGFVILIIVLYLVCRKKQEDPAPAEPKNDDANRTAELVA